VGGVVRRIAFRGNESDAEEEDFWTDKRIGAWARVIFAVVKREAKQDLTGEWKTSYVGIARIIGSAPSTAVKAIRQLEAVGYLSVRQYSEDAHYRLFKPLR